MSLSWRGKKNQFCVTELPRFRQYHQDPSHCLPLCPWHRSSMRREYLSAADGGVSVVRRGRPDHYFPWNIFFFHAQPNDYHRSCGFISFSFSLLYFLLVLLGRFDTVGWNTAVEDVIRSPWLLLNLIELTYQPINFRIMKWWEGPFYGVSKLNNPPLYFPSASRRYKT